MKKHIPKKFCSTLQGNMHMQSLLSDKQMQQQGSMKLQRENAPMLASKEPGSRQPPTLMVMDANQCAQQKEASLNL